MFHIASLGTQESAHAEAASNACVESVPLSAPTGQPCVSVVTDAVLESHRDTSNVNVTFKYRVTNSFV